MSGISSIAFTVYNDASNKQLGAVISHNNTPLYFFFRIPINPQFNYTTTDKELLSVVECITQFRRIIFGYKIKLLSYHKNWSMPPLKVNIKE